MKLFRNRQKEEPDVQEAQEAQDEVLNAVPMEPARKSELVLDIEGGLDSDPKLELPDLKAETKALPDSEEVFLGELRTILETAKENSQEEAEAVLKPLTPEIQEAPDPERKPEAEKPLPQAAATAKPEASAEKPLASVSYESMAEAAASAQKEPTGRFTRDAVDDESFLAELYTLIGDGSHSAAPRTEGSAESERERPTPKLRTPVELNEEQLQNAPEEFEEVLEDDSTGVPGWLKGVFLLLISLLLSAMTFYAVASDVIGEIF